MKIAIFEDDEALAMRLKIFIMRETHHPAAICTGNKLEMEWYIQDTPEPILYFLDIVTDGKSTGFTLAQQIKERNNGSLITFITAYPQLILSNALYKTIAFNVVVKGDTLEQEIAHTIHLARQVMDANALYIHNGRYENLHIPLANICYMETIKGQGRIRIYCLDGEYTVRDTLKRLHKTLGSSFVRCHKSILANKNNIRKVDKTGKVIHFTGGLSCYYRSKGGID